MPETRMTPRELIGSFVIWLGLMILPRSTRDGMKAIVERGLDRL